MKTLLTSFIILSSLFLFTGCSKTADVPETKEARVARLLTGVGNRYWRLSKVYLNNAQQTLTDSQMKYTKTYTADPSNVDPNNSKTGSFTNSDGYIGKWKIISAGDQLYETFTNNPAGPVANYYIINEISETLLDIEYTANMRSVREVYFAY